jgi:hypothetical protein
MDNNSSAKWKTLKKMLGRNVNRLTVPKMKMADGTISNESSMIAFALNTHFATIGKKN